MCNLCEKKKLDIDQRIPHFIDGMLELDEFRTKVHTHGGRKK